MLPDEKFKISLFQTFHIPYLYFYSQNKTIHTK
jgi:hypothetical protein